MVQRRPLPPSMLWLICPYDLELNQWRFQYREGDKLVDRKIEAKITKENQLHI